MSRNNIGKLSGFQDFLPEEMRGREQVLDVIRDVYRSFAFLPQDTPALEYAELLMGSYGENEKLVYNFRDHGNRWVALRYDLTVPLSRIIRMYGHQLSLPYRRYQIGSVWRADRPGKGRYREFVQSDADIIGDDSVLADVEMILLVQTILQKLGVDAIVHINSREVLEGLAETYGASEREKGEIFRSVDKLDKIGLEGVLQELAQKDIRENGVIREYLSIEMEGCIVPEKLNSLIGGTNSGARGIARLEQIAVLLQRAGKDSHVCINPRIARGLDYYTGVVFETTMVEKPEFGSICSGGRYDKLIMLPSGETTPAIGFSVGVDRLLAALKELKLLEKLTKRVASVYVVQFSEDYLPTYLNIASVLREGRIPTEVAPLPIRISQQLQAANKRGAKYAVLIGEDEMKAGTAQVKDLSTGLQKAVPQDHLAQYFALKGEGHSE